MGFTPYMFILFLFISTYTYSLQAPIVLGPENTVLIEGTQLRIKWQPLESGQWCQIQVASDPAFIQLLANEDNIYGTEWTYEPLPQDGNVYYWRIRARMTETPLLEGEGEVSTEGEGELLVEGETPLEGEGELAKEGESFLEGEVLVEGEGELPAEGENENIYDDCGCDCNNNKITTDTIKRKLGDYLLFGLTVITFFRWASNPNHP